MARLVAVIASFMAYYLPALTAPFVPFVIYGLCTLAGTLGSIFLPEWLAMRVILNIANPKILSMSSPTQYCVGELKL